MVASVIPVFILLHPRIFHTNRHEVVSAIPAFVLHCLRIGYTNRPVVASVMPAFVLLHPRISYTNPSAVVNVMSVFYLLHLHISHTNCYEVVGTTPLICAGAVMSCLLSRTLYIIRCIAVSNEMGFIDRIYQTPKLTNSQRISLPSPLGEGLGVRLFFPLFRHHHHFNPIPLRH